MFVVGIDERNILDGLYKSRQIRQIFRIGICNPVSLGNDMIARIRKIAVIAAPKNSGTLYPMPEIGVPENSRLSQRGGTDILRIRNLVVF